MDLITITKPNEQQRSEFNILVVRKRISPLKMHNEHVITMLTLCNNVLQQ